MLVSLLIVIAFARKYRTGTAVPNQLVPVPYRCPCSKYEFTWKVKPLYESP